jgi:5-methyltetrahydropteroyltriglutamate--homocysteine methyltransferase
MRTEVTFRELQDYRSQQGMGFRAKPPAVCDGPIGHGALDLVAPCARAKRLAGRPLKFTLTGPHMLAKTVIDRHYGDVATLADAIAEVLAEQVGFLDAAVIQIDEANLPGHPEEWPWAAAAINRVLDAVRTTPTVHLCFGNYGGQVVQRGTWARLIEYLNALHVDHVVLECAHRPPQELAAFKELRPEIGFGLGVIDIKRTEVESADQVARAIERAAAVLGPERIRYIHPDCGFWMLKRPIADAKIAALVDGRDLYEGRLGPASAGPRQDGPGRTD